jgi:hypothetical protein
VYRQSQYIYSYIYVPVYPTHLGPQVEVNFITPPLISHLTFISHASS